MEGLIPDFAKLGLVGLMIALLIGIVIRQQLRVGDLEKQNAELFKMVLLEANKRADDNRAQDEVVRGSMAAMHNLAEAQRVTQVAVSAQSGFIQRIEQAIQPIGQAVQLLVARKR